VTVTGIGGRTSHGVTDAGGEVVLTLPDRFKGTAVVLREGFAPRVAAVAAPGGEDRILALEMDPAVGDERRIEILDGRRGTPLVGVLLTLDDGRIRACVRTSEDGIAPYPEGRMRFPMRLEARKAGYHPGRFILRRDPPRKGGSFRMYSDAGVVLAFRSWDGSPAEGIRVRFRVNGDGWIGETLQALTGAGGEVRFRGFAIGQEMRCFVTGDTDLAPPFVWSGLLQPYLKGRELFSPVMERGFPVEGELGGVLPAVPPRVEFVFPSGIDLPFGPETPPLPVRSVPVDPGGGFLLTGAREGPVQARVLSEDVVFAVLGLSVQRGRLLRIDLREPWEMVVAVLDDRGAPLPGASVLLLRTDEGFPVLRHKGRTDATGRFRHAGASPARYLGSVTAPGFMEAGFDLPLHGTAPALVTVALRRR